MSISSWSLEVMCVVWVRLVAVGAVRVNEDHSGFSELAVGVGWLVVLGFWCLLF